MVLDYRKVLNEFKAQNIPVADVKSDIVISVSNLQEKLFKGDIDFCSMVGKNLDDIMNKGKDYVEIVGYKPRRVGNKILVKPEVIRYSFLIGEIIQKKPWTKISSHGWVSVNLNPLNYVNDVTEPYVSQVDQMMKKLEIPPRTYVKIEK